MKLGDDRPRILDDDQAAMMDEYGISSAIDAARSRWQETALLQRAGSAHQPQFLALHPIIATLRARFQGDYDAARKALDKKKRHTLKALHAARERLQLVSGEHAPLDEDVHAEHDALAPVVASIERALKLMTSYEARLCVGARLPWYRRRIGDHGYWKKMTGTTPGAWVAGHEDTEMATRADEIWFARAGADPIVALKIAQAAMQAVKPPAVKKKRGQTEDEQINHVLWLICDQALGLNVSDAQALLIALGYPPEKARIKPLHARLHRLRKQKGLQQTVAPQPSRRRKP